MSFRLLRGAGERRPQKIFLVAFPGSPIAPEWITERELRAIQMDVEILAEKEVPDPPAPIRVVR